jgi:hypothetical protein
MILSDEKQVFRNDEKSCLFLGGGVLVDVLFISKTPCIIINSVGILV